MLQKLKYKLRYWRRCVLLAFGRCPKCRARVNWTTTGRPICPECGN